MHADIALAPRRLALRACRLFQTADMDEARDAISRVMQPHDLRLHRPTRPVRSHMDYLRLGGLGLGTIAFGPATIDVPPLAGYHLLVFCLSGHGTIRTTHGMATIDPFSGVACAPGQPVAGTFSDDCEQFVLRIDRQRLAAFVGADDPRLAPTFDLRAPRMRPWLTTLRTLVTCPTSLALVQADRAAASDYEQLLLRLLLAAQQPEPPEPLPGPRPVAVRRALAFIEAYAASPLTLAEIAAAAGVPERTLHDAFRQFEGTSPLRHLRDLRLGRARASLQAGASVTEAATAAGFTHLGRFAQDYAARFGERPSQTGRTAFHATGFSPAAPRTPPATRARPPG